MTIINLRRSIDIIDYNIKIKTERMKIIHAIKTIGRLIISAIFLSFIGFAFSGSWYFWNWHWTGIVAFFFFLVSVFLIACEDYGYLPKSEIEDEDFVDYF